MQELCKNVLSGAPTINLSDLSCQAVGGYEKISVCLGRYENKTWPVHMAALHFLSKHIPFVNKNALVTPPPP
jgi:hypothetical protein